MARTRKPTKLKIEHSGLREDRDKIKIDGVDLQELEVPEILNLKALNIYKDLAVKVSDMGILMVIDCYALSILANDVYDYGEIVKQMQDPDQKSLMKDSAGYFRRNPLMLEKNKLAENILSVGKLFGLTPINRAGLPVEYEAAKKKHEQKAEPMKFEKRWSEI